MTREDKEAILNSFDETMIQPDEAMNLTEMRAYVKGLKMLEMQCLMRLTSFIEVIRRIRRIQSET